MADPDQTDAEFNASVARLLRKEAIRRAAHDKNTTFGPGLEAVLAEISAESTADAARSAPNSSAIAPSRNQIEKTATAAASGPPTPKGDRPVRA